MPGITRAAEETGSPAPTPMAYRGPANFAISRPARELAAEAVAPVSGEPIKEVERPPTPEETITGTGSPDGALQTKVKGKTPAPGMDGAAPAIVSFDGLSNSDNFTFFGSRLSPPDTNGDVGPNHYVQMTNLLVRVFDKSGTTLSTFKLSSLFASLGGAVAASDKGDPIVLYDPLADRWILSQFAFSSSTTPPYHEAIAISKTGDPLGAYYLYDFVMPGVEFPDYPKLGVWRDGYYMTDVQFTNGGAFNGAGAFAFDRAKMLVGDPTAGFIYFGFPTSSRMLPCDIDGLNPPPAGAPAYFAKLDATEFGQASDALRIYEFHADFATPANSTFTERPESPIAVAAFDPTSPSGRADIPQPAPALATHNLDSLSDRLMFRLQYRNMAGTDSLVVCHTVDVNATAAYQAGVRYYQLKRPPAGNFSVVEQASFAPDTNNRWMGSAAVDHQGNLAVGYSVSSATVFPSVRYAARLATDPPNGLFQGEATLVAGSGVQQSTSSRWGDYSSLTVDPTDDSTFWFTTEYYTAASQATSAVGWLTRVSSFRMPGAVAVAQGTISGTVTNAVTAGPVPNVLVELSNGFSATTVAAGTYSKSLAPGSYTVTRVSAHGYATLTPGTPIVITNGGNVVANYVLSPIPIIEKVSAIIIAEGYAPANGTIDPGEIVSVSFTLRNTGAADTVNLVGTLAATGGVLLPSGPQNYGVVVAGGASVSRTFTFHGGAACGSTITASLQAQDGAANLGAFTFDFLVGTPAIIFTQNFDSVVAPALPAGWASTATGAQSAWVTQASTFDTTPNSAFVPDPATVGRSELVSPPVPITTTTAKVTFRNNYNLESTFDGGVLEIKIGAGAFADILTAGGSFVSGGYNGTISSSFSNPLAGRSAWTGSSAGYITTTVNLPAAAAGQSIQLRWVCGTDTSVAGTGWRIDTVSIADGLTCIVPTPIAITATGGTPQSTTIGFGFATALAATVTDISGNPAVGATVTFTAPGAGASGTFPGALTSSTVTADFLGVATAPAFTANGVAGSYSVNASVPGVAVPAVFALTNNPAVTVGPASLPAWTVNQAGYSQTVSATGGTGAKTFSVTAGAIPTGMTLSAAGLLSGTPTAANTFNFTVTATDTVGATGAHAYTVVINPAVSITTATLPDWTQGVAYTPIVAATDGTGGKTFTVTGGTHPTGLSLNSDGSFSGTPSAAGLYSFSITATDTTGATGVQAYGVTINPPITITPLTLPIGQVNVAYGPATVFASGGTGTKVFSITSGIIPTGLTFNTGSGLLNGTPTVGASFSFTVTATDAIGATGARAYTIMINRPPLPGVVTVERFPTQGVKITVQQIVGAATDPDPGDTITLVSVGNGAHGTASLSTSNGTTGFVFYTPNANDPNGDTFNYVIQDNHGAQAIGSVTVNIKADNALSMNITIRAVLPNGDVAIDFSGIPGYIYGLQFTPSLVPPTWITIAPAPTDAFGQGHVVDTPPHSIGGSGFYRLVYPYVPPIPQD